MPIYYFETDDGNVFRDDLTGVDLPNDLAARQEVVRAFPDMIRELVPDDDERIYAATARNENGDIVYKATMTFRGEWMLAKVIPIKRR